MPNIQKKYFAIIASSGFVLFAAQPAMAATATSELEVSATVTSNCSVTTSAISFGNVDVTSGQAVDGTGSISVTCTSGTAWAASADAGNGTDASLATRKMSDGGSNLLDYALYTDSNRATVWGDGVGGTTSTITDNGTGSAQTKTIYGTVLAGQTGLPAGTYNDSVTVTITY